MHIVLMVLLVALFGYALALILANHSEVAVNLLFNQVPAMNVGLLLIVSLVLGLAIGMLVALVVFKVLQAKLEIARLKKHNQELTNQLQEANVVIDQHRNSQSLAQTAHTLPKV